MKIVIVGPGALGCLLAGLLSKNAEVFLLDKNPKRAERLNKNGGISCQGISKWQSKVPVMLDPGEIKDADLVIICVKAYHTKEAIVGVKSMIGENTTVLTLQNGLGNEEVISEVVGRKNVLVGVTNHSVKLLDEGKIEHVADGPTMIGNIDGEIPAITRQIREIFNKSGIETKVSREIKGVIWSRLMINVGVDALSAITRLSNSQLIEIDSAAEILRAAVTEGVKVAKKRRVKFIYDDPLSKVEAVCEAATSQPSVILQDILNKKKTEVDFINGVIVRQGVSAGIPTPVNFTLLNLVKSIEASYAIK